MAHQRKSVIRSAAPAVTARLPVLAQVRIESEADFFDRVRLQAKDRREGRRKTPVATVSFESVGALLTVLTPKRYALFEAVRQHGGFASIEALAAEVQRDRATVSRDIKALAGAGLLSLRETPSPGHGKRTEIAPAAEQLKVELVL
jgi:predicted transcriptional regulator